MACLDVFIFGRWTQFFESIDGLSIDYFSTKLHNSALAGVITGLADYLPGLDHQNFLVNFKGSVTLAARKLSPQDRNGSILQ